MKYGDHKIFSDMVPEAENPNSWVMFTYHLWRSDILGNLKK